MDQIAARTQPKDSTKVKDYVMHNIGQFVADTSLPQITLEQSAQMRRAVRNAPLKSTPMALLKELIDGARWYGDDLLVNWTGEETLADYIGVTLTPLKAAISELARTGFIIQAWRLKDKSVHNTPRRNFDGTFAARCYFIVPAALDALRDRSAGVKNQQRDRSLNQTTAATRNRSRNPRSTVDGFSNPPQPDSDKNRSLNQATTVPNATVPNENVINVMDARARENDDNQRNQETQPSPESSSHETASGSERSEIIARPSRWQKCALDGCDSREHFASKCRRHAHEDGAKCCKRTNPTCSACGALDDAAEYPEVHAYYTCERCLCKYASTLPRPDGEKPISMERTNREREFVKQMQAQHRARARGWAGVCGLEIA